MRNSYINLLIAGGAMRRAPVIFSTSQFNCVTPVTARDSIAVTQKGARRHRREPGSVDGSDAVTAIGEFLRVRVRVRICVRTQNNRECCHGVTDNVSERWMRGIEGDSGAVTGCHGASRVGAKVITVITCYCERVEALTNEGRKAA